MHKMNVCKEFMQHIRKVSYKDVYLLIESDIFPHLTECVRLLSEVKFEDGSYHAFYGYIKKYITSFMIYWKIATDDIIQEADKYSSCGNKEEIMELMDRTIDIHQSRQIAFGKSFLPVQSQLEKQVYDEMEELYKQYMERLFELKAIVGKLDKQDKVNDFAKVHFKITVKKTNEIFEATHTFIALMLADRLNSISVSLEEILQRLKNNLRSVQEECDEKLYELLHEMYDKNKELLLISRQDRRSSVECAEAGRSIDRVREKIEYSNYSNPSLSRLEEEVVYWQTRLNEFRECADKLMRLKKDQEDVMKQEQTYNSMKTTELPGSRKQCWLNIGENFAQRREYLKARIIEAARTLVTFFAVKGADRILYTDDVGLYYIDEFNHQVYVFDNSLRFYHTNCEGEFREVSDQVNYYFDKFGRYIKGEEGEKIYQLAPCTSQYKVQANTNLLTKVTKDCGHSEKPNQKCHQRIKDPTRPEEVLPHVEKVDLKSTLTPEVVKYLWDSFGHILPFALRDVGRDRTKNPIHHLAHQILQYKYNRTKDELRHEMKEAEDYRANIFKERQERAMEASKAWKSKQVKRRKPEESDDADDRVVRDVQATEHAIVDSMNYYDNYD